MSADFTSHGETQKLR